MRWRIDEVKHDMANRKFSIIREIDIDKLDAKIDQYVEATGETNPYLFMHKHTIDALPTFNDTLSCLRSITAVVNGLAGYYCGCKVFRDDTLAFGDVEIR